MDQGEYYRTHPPRCLAEFVAIPTELPDVSFDGHGEPINPVFALACPCGSLRHKVHGFRGAGVDSKSVMLRNPIALECDACGKRAVVFDDATHGHDAEIGYPPPRQEQGEPVVDDCGACGKHAAEVFARFEYPTDLLTEPDAERAQELFTWFTLVGRCSACSQMLGFADVECA